MTTWTFIIFALFIQEPASTDAAIFLIREQHINLWLINLIWATATVIDITVGYLIGKWIQRRFQNAKLVKWSERWATRIENFIGRKGERFSLILLGIINFPYLNAFLASWLKLSFKNVFILIFIGDTLYWIIEWVINVSVRSYFSDSHTVLYVVVGLGLLFSIVSKAILNKILKKL